MTNGDRLRSMLTDETIAEKYFCVFWDECCDCPLNKYYNYNCIDIKIRLNYLKDTLESERKKDAKN